MYIIALYCVQFYGESLYCSTESAFLLLMVCSQHIDLCHLQKELSVLKDLFTSHASGTAAPRPAPAGDLLDIRPSLTDEVSSAIMG